MGQHASFMILFLFDVHAVPVGLLLSGWLILPHGVRWVGWVGGSTPNFRFFGQVGHDGMGWDGSASNTSLDSS